MSRPDFIAPGLISDTDLPTLIGGRDRQTGRVVFPCPGDAERYDEVLLPRRGTIWSWTVQRFRPKTPPYKGPEAFEPFAMGYVELPGAVIVETRFSGIPFDQLTIGMPVEFRLEPFPAGPGGAMLTSYAFGPVQEGVA